ncbi:uncharacterized protein LOC131630719 [Vicia villosa]|uniref:uncharacterized protein LOC131630719 n=1 Tax=Vicia villosa TaxID=3911 RepID=UPI00273C127A|nr:uncharacterized protein LOC131630719 [Vicia villosa]
MEKWKDFPLSKEEEEGVTVEREEICGKEAFQRTLAGRLWTDSSFNSRAFISTMLGAWKLRNPDETQELSKNLFLFHFSTKRDLESVLRNGPWSFDRNILVLARVSGEEQPSELNMHFGVFWVRVYELPLMLRSEVMARKLGGILGKFEEMDTKEANRIDRFLRLKVTIDLKMPLKRGTVVRFKDKNLRVFFKYERLPTFCFVCGRLGHQLKDCESTGDLGDEGFEDIKENDLLYGQWIRASPLPRVNEEVRKKDSNSSSCSKSLFNLSSGQSKCEARGKEKEGEGEVEQHKDLGDQRKDNLITGNPSPAAAPTNFLEIEAVAESFGAVDISNVGAKKGETSKGKAIKKRSGPGDNLRGNRVLRRRSGRLRQWREEEERKPGSHDLCPTITTRGGVGRPTPPRTMKIVSWNCRGLGNPRAVRALLRLNRLENPDVLLVMESRLKYEEVSSLKIKSGFGGVHVVDCRGFGKDRAGGLILFWKEGFLLSILSSSLNHIAGSMIDEEDGQLWNLYGIYGHPEEQFKRKTWQLIQTLVREEGGNAIVFGDLNDILWDHEKRGGISRTNSQFLWGRNAVISCGLVDLGFEGYPFTWTNGRLGEDNTQCRLDRAMASNSFINRFSPVKVKHLSRFHSDHAAISISLEVDESLNSVSRKRPYLFRFEEVWSKDPRCERFVDQIWNEPSSRGLNKFDRIQNLDAMFKEYRRGEISKELRRIEEQLGSEFCWAEGHGDISRNRALVRQRDKLLQTEEIMWRQRSRALWLKYGDKNSKFFHGKASQRRKTNLIKKIKDENGYWWRGHDNYERILVTYFTDIFSSSFPTNMVEVCKVVEGRLKAEHVRICEESYTAAEVKTALFQMHPLKAPGPDGLPALFYQKFWHIVGSDICKLVLDILNNQKHPGIINNTHIALIPKCKTPTKPKDFRPISLCNVVMKLVSKVIANRLKIFLPEIIDEEQSAFVKDRLIMDNALIAMEGFHWMKKKVKGKKGTMALKLDMSKAYDRLEWEFIVEVLTSMGFPRSMVVLIEKCISSVSYKVLINGAPSRCFTPERGLRQGDPFSPYLFILCANVFSGLIKKAANHKEIHGLKIARNSPMITHLFFADDSLLFARASLEEARRIKDILKVYERASGQMVNFDKSEVSFSKNVGENTQAIIRNHLNVNTVSNHSKYLGLPVILGRSKKVVFSLVVERVWKKIKGWKEKFLSTAGREILIKAVVQAIPTYVMSCYKLPISVCNELEALVSNFWWGAKGGERKLHWLRWEKLAKAKNVGGLGFRNINDFNSCLLGKTYWRLLSNDDSLVGKVLKGRYFPRGSIDTCDVGYCPSYAWRSILSAREVVQRGARWRIGNGEKVKILNDCWIPGNPEFKLLFGTNNVGEEDLVSTLIDKDLGVWKREIIYESFSPDDAKKIVSIPLSRLPNDDKLVWHFEKSGEFSVKTAYHATCSFKTSLLPGPSISACHSLWKLLWKAPIYAKQRNFLWRVAQDILPTRGNLVKKGMIIDPLCPFCFSGIENVQHLFMECHFAKQVLFASSVGYRIPNCMDVNYWIQSILECGDTHSVQVLCVCLYKIWAATNLIVFQGKTVCPMAVAGSVSDCVQDFARWPPDPIAKNLAPAAGIFDTFPKDVHFAHVDAGFTEDEHTVFGCTFKDPFNKVILAASKKDLIMVEPSLAELLALRWCILLAAEINLEKVVFYTDALVVVDCINSIHSNASLDPIAAECRQLLSSFSFSSVIFVPRNCNFDAHNVVLLGKMYGSRTWLEGLPRANSVSLPFHGL